MGRTLWSDKGTVMSTNRTVLLIGVLTPLLFGSAKAFGEELVPCIDAISVNLNSTSRFSYEEGASEVFVVETYSEGLLAVHATVPLGDGVEPRIRFLGADCRASHQTSASTSRPRSYVSGEEIRIPSPGTYYVQVSSQDQALPLGEFKLIVGFSAKGSEGPEVEMKDGTGAGETDQDPVDETIPLLFDCPKSMTLRASTKDGTGTGETDQDPVDETIPLISGCFDEPVTSERLDLCRTGQEDDFGDDFTCATLLVAGTGVNGSIRNGWGDDQDVFALIVEDWRTLRVEIRGDFALLPVLYDLQGQRMASSPRQDGATLSVVKRFAPGIYFLRIGGFLGAEGSYSLAIEDAGW